MSKGHRDRALVLAAMALWHVPALAQTPAGDPDTSITDIVTGALALSPEESFAEARHERLVWFIEHPLDLNTAGEVELTGIPGVQLADARRVLAWRARIGAFSRIEQLLGHGPEGERLFSLLAPFVVVRPSVPANAYVRTRFARRSASGGGTDDGDGVLPGWREYHRLGSSIGRAASGELLVLREPWQRYSQAFITGSCTVTWENGIVDRAIVGDLTADGAHGLVFGQMRGWAGDGRSVAWSGPMRIEPFHGTYGTRMVRGAAVAKAMRTITGVLSAGAFIGHTPFIASLDGSGCLRSLDLRETIQPSASSTRATVYEWSAGLRLAWNPVAGVSFGASGLWMRLGRQWAGQGAYGREGGECICGGDVSVGVGNATISAEVAAMKEGFAVAAGMWLKDDPHTSFSASIWYCSPGFRNGKSGSTARGGDLANDAGIHLSGSCIPVAGLTLAGTLLRYKRPWCTSTSLLPPAGAEVMLKATLRISPAISLSAGARSVSAESWQRADRQGALPAWGMITVSRRTMSATVGCRMTRALRLDTRLDHVTSGGDGDDSQGWLMSQAIQLAIVRGLSIDVCWTLVRTGGYAARAYAIERDVAGAYSAPPLSGTGLRWYVYLRASFVRGLTFSGRYAETRRSAGPVLTVIEPAATLQCDVNLRDLTAD